MRLARRRAHKRKTPHIAKIPPGVGLGAGPGVAPVVLFGATGELARRKLLSGCFQLTSAGFSLGCRIIAMSLDELDDEGLRAASRTALDESSSRNVADAIHEAERQGFKHLFQPMAGLLRAPEVLAPTANRANFGAISTGR